MGLTNAEGPFLLAHIVHTFDLSLACPPEEITRIMSITVNPNKMPLIFTPRAVGAGTRDELGVCEQVVG